MTTTGTSATLADRILLFVGDQFVFPLDRSAIRIVARHGWVDADASYDEWQSILLRGLEQSACPPAELSVWFSQLGRDFCGPRARCEALEAHIRYRALCGS